MNDSAKGKLHVVVLAAGKGTRMRSATPKVLHEIAGRSMLAHCLDTASGLDPAGIRVVIGHEGETVLASQADREVQWVWQHDQNGTGHAVQLGIEGLDAAADDRVLVLYADVPLLGGDTLRELAATDAVVSLLTVHMDDPTGYGRILRDESGSVRRIVEQKDASEAERQVQEVNTGILMARYGDLVSWLDRLEAGNAQGELYLTDIVEMAAGEGKPVDAVIAGDAWEVTGVNDRLALARLERVYQERQAEALALSGTTVADPTRLDIRGTLECGTDVSIDVGCVFEGEVRLGDNVRIGPHCVLRDCEIGSGSTVEAFSHVDGVVAAGDNAIGPYARLRPGAALDTAAKIGNFVEVKAARIGERSKVNHLSYVGDTRVGDDCNLGAGTITCNYDGANKHHTEIGDRVFVGSASQLVAPVTLGDDVTVGAGSTITRNVAEGRLAVARARQSEIDGWRRPQKKGD
ncbi:MULTISPECIES: bifunctional UDP-N-acetylglucosamine diphosphorylase/glucosamine-1-phosphate N-acetyltransferase GlmU [unclassified Guyparkeria]|uniref:bifunctional UDP-N-acetylglucosamine diphosphorylase/glucosamine-1-phosphate N-acetyltransferase GlmU n=1 Tax=unclassified Guyparkeria TaxID=2626246 RepID=UPI0007334794|nr:MULTISPECIES: bifunctional UDP-N-acetylglucosamine diphosphorylase/glucosamine-1-phosphate N-acetyltransferase GlmU [unclassified Guyparkeria]KTG16654.1 bifunctional N-acetylglucosamine-1-phosphate uridyltransferase/glucosamine-1-phosphate acetyltransferase [Guyparkeria sp. XI15]OAE85688.1 bifunctional N-acetylglucosamine-1-phosphate uridyltransferase/glucosamine-1-phosphate acetyltransferase [Guyparkeria sp. WRN-7]